MHRPSKMPVLAGLDAKPFTMAVCISVSLTADEGAVSGGDATRYYNEDAAVLKVLEALRACVGGAAHDDL